MLIFAFSFHFRFSLSRYRSQHNNSTALDAGRGLNHVSRSHVIQHNSLFRLRFSIISGNKACEATRIPSQENESDVVV